MYINTQGISMSGKTYLRFTPYNYIYNYIQPVKLNSLRDAQYYCTWPQSIIIRFRVMTSTHLIHDNYITIPNLASTYLSIVYISYTCSIQHNHSYIPGTENVKSSVELRKSTSVTEMVRRCMPGVRALCGILSGVRAAIIEDKKEFMTERQKWIEVSKVCAKRNLCSMLVTLH